MRTLVVELTTRCPLRCRHCFVAPGAVAYDLEPALLARLLDEAWTTGFRQVSFTGGECATHPGFPQALTLAAGRGYRVGFVSSGIGFARLLPHVERLRAQLSAITFSLDGVSPTTHDRLRGDGAFRRVLQAISLCAVRRLPFTINTVITAENSGELHAIADLAAALGARGIRFGHLVLSEATGAPGLALPDGERIGIDRAIRAWSAACPIPVALAPGHYTPHLIPCAPLRQREAACDARGRLIWCCQLPPDGAGRFAAGDLAAEPFPVLFARLGALRRRLLHEKRTRPAPGRFPCAECAAFLGMIQEMPDAQF